MQLTATIFLVLTQLVLSKAGKPITVCDKYTEVEVPCEDPCPPTCQRPIAPVCLSTGCVPGCDCKPGFVRREIGGPCVQPKFCEGHCESNQEYRKCGSPCPRTCQQHPLMTKLCLNKYIAGCFCEDGYTFDEITESCVRDCKNPFN